MGTSYCRAIGFVRAELNSQLDRLTLPHILERTRDTDEHVRRAAYKFLAEKVHIKSLTIGQREGLLQRGLGERSEAVR